MTKRLFVGGIPYDITEDQIRDYFAKIGTVVSCNIIQDKYTGKSKGFGFVEMSTEEEAKKAMESYDGQDFEGRKITVKEARPMEDRGSRPEAAEDTKDQEVKVEESPKEETSGDMEETPADEE